MIQPPHCILCWIFLCSINLYFKAFAPTINTIVAVSISGQFIALLQGRSFKCRLQQDLLLLDEFGFQTESEGENTVTVVWGAGNCRGQQGPLHLQCPNSEAFPHLQRMETSWAKESWLLLFWSHWEKTQNLKGTISLHCSHEYWEKLKRHSH